LTTRQRIWDLQEQINTALGNMSEEQLAKVDKYLEQWIEQLEQTDQQKGKEEL